jgi:hypothetical protein
MKVPLGNGFEDYDPDDPEIDFRKKRWDYWGALKKIRMEYLDSSLQESTTILPLDPDKFGEYVESKYGIKIRTDEGKITDKYDIVDEKLYTFFLLKWM